MVWPTVYDVEDAKYNCLREECETSEVKNHLDHQCKLEKYSVPPQMRLTGIICGISPLQQVSSLERMMENGMDIARLDYGDGPLEEQAQTIANIREAVANYSQRLQVTYPLAIALNLKGAEIRTGLLEAGVIQLRPGAWLQLTTDEEYYDRGDEEIIYVDYKNITNVVTRGDRIYLDEGLICLVCLRVEESVVTCFIRFGGTLTSYSTVNLSSVEVDLPAVTEEDEDYLRFAVENQVDVVMVSFVREGSTADQVREILGIKGSNIMVISKIEDRQGMENLDAILHASDGIMIARSDFSIQVPTEKLFVAQKCISVKGNNIAKPVVCVTEILGSMMKKLYPTHAETSDVANGVIDGIDCFVVRKQTLGGNWTNEVLRTMGRLCKQAEASLWSQQFFENISGNLSLPLECTHTIATVAVQLSIKCAAAAIAAHTTSGRTAKLLSKYRPRCPIIAITRNIHVAKRCQMHRGIVPLFYEFEAPDNWEDDVRSRLNFAIGFGERHGFISPGDVVIAVYGSKRGLEYSDTIEVVNVPKLEILGEMTCGCV